MKNVNIFLNLRKKQKRIHMSIGNFIVNITI